MTDLPTTAEVRKKTKSKYSFYAIFSMALVLFMLGILGMILLHAQSLTRYFKENIEFIIALSDQATDTDADNLIKDLNQEVFVKSARYVSKEAAAAELTSKTGENFVETLGYNPLFASVVLYLHAPYANSDSLSRIKERIQHKPIVQDIFYQATLLDVINNNVSKLGMLLIALSVIFLLIAIALIDSTIKLAMYANRFLIKSMQLVGATRQFISQPFLQQSLIYGLYSGIAAVFLLIIILFWAHRTLPELTSLFSFWRFSVWCIFLIILGTFISWWSTKRSVVKYLQTQLDDLY